MSECVICLEPLGRDSVTRWTGSHAGSSG
eukprot:COSAG02_NODE_62843_length_264_cov_4.460606_1_plen_28_part_01